MAFISSTLTVKFRCAWSAGHRGPASSESMSYGATSRTNGAHLGRCSGRSNMDDHSVETAKVAGEERRFGRHQHR
jgi:hypothetical protein